MTKRPFERPATIALPDAAARPPGASLEGLWLPPSGAGFEADEGAVVGVRESVGAASRGGAVVAAPHPLMGGAMDSPVATEIALAASDAGFASLRFNWRGVGASAGTPSGETSDADEDYAAALEFVEESVDGGLLACGYSWGALAAARVAPQRKRVRRLVLIAPPPAMLDSARLTEWGRPLLVVAGDRDDYVPEAELRARLADCPRAELVLLEGVDHFFVTGLAEVGRATREWLAD